MNDFDDLEPDFVPSPGAGMLGVADRVYAWRTRRRIVMASVCGAAVFVAAVSFALGSGDDHADKLTVLNEVTTTEAPTTTTPIILSTIPPSSTTTASSTTVPAPTSTTALPVASDTTTTADRTTTTTTPGHITVEFDRAQLLLQGGDTAKISYTVTNDGDGAAHIPVPACLSNQLWPRDQSRERPLLWAVPVHAVTACTTADPSPLIDGHTTQTFSETVLAGQRDTESGDVVPAPAGATRFLLTVPLQNKIFGLPVAITPPSSAPITVDHPSDVTTPSGARRSVNFTITNNLPFPVRYVDEGPCAQLDNDSPCYPNLPKPNDWTGYDMRLAPYKDGAPLFFTRYVLEANQTLASRGEVHGTVALFEPGFNVPDMPPGVYFFYWDGDKVKFTVTP